MFQVLRQALASFIAPEIVAQNRSLRSERRNAERLSRRDELTGLANRRAFNLAQSEAGKSSKFSFVVFDANNFKKVNDSFGHSAGDAVLKQIAFVLKSEAARFGFAERVFRLGGDEFAAIIPSRLAEEFRDNVELTFGVRTIGEARVSVSGTVAATFEAADESLQSRKSARKSGMVKI